MSPDAQPLSKVTRSSTAKPGDEVLVLRSGAADPKDRVVLVPAKEVAAGGLTLSALLTVLGAGTGVTLTVKGSKLIIDSILTTAQAPAQPEAPTDGRVDDIGNNLNGGLVPGYPAVADYEVFGAPGFPGVVNASAAGGDVQNGRIFSRNLTGEILPGGAGIRVAASGARPAGKWLLNATAFTGPSVVTPPAGDTTAPVISITVPTAGAVLTVGQAVTLTAQATDNVAVTGVTFTNGGTGAVLGTGAKNGNAYTYSYTPTTAGALTITATAVDAAGNSQAASVSVTVQAVSTPATKLDAPTGLSLVPLSSSTIGASWNPVANATGYRLRLNGSTTYMPGTATSYVLTGLAAATQVSVEVQALYTGTDPYLPSDYSAAVQATTQSGATVTPRLVRVDGHSLNWFYPATSGETLADKLKAVLGTTNYTDYSTIAVAGQTIAQMLTRERNGGPYGGTINAGYGPDFVGTTLPDRTGQPFGIVTVLSALNSLAAIAEARINGNASGANTLLAQAKADLTSYCSEVTAKNWRIILLEEAAAQSTSGTYTANSGAGNAIYYQEQLNWNTWLTANATALGASALLRTATYPEFGSASATANATLYQADNTHLTEAGRALLASKLAPGVVRVGNGETGIVIAYTGTTTPPPTPVTVTANFSGNGYAQSGTTLTKTSTNTVYTANEFAFSTQGIAPNTGGVDDFEWVVQNQSESVVGLTTVAGILNAKEHDPTLGIQYGVHTFDATNMLRAWGTPSGVGDASNLSGLIPYVSGDKFKIKVGATVKLFINDVEKYDFGAAPPQVLYPTVALQSTTSITSISVTRTVTISYPSLVAPSGATAAAPNYATAGTYDDSLFTVGGTTGKRLTGEWVFDSAAGGAIYTLEVGATAEEDFFSTGFTYNGLKYTNLGPYEIWLKTGTAGQFIKLYTGTAFVGNDNNLNSQPMLSFAGLPLDNYTVQVRNLSHIWLTSMTVA